MNDWFYTKARQQHGPVNLHALQMMIREGQLNPATDLAWNASMTDWLPIGQIPELNGPFDQQPPNPAFSSQPFAYALSTGPMHEIEPGSEQIMATACLKRAWDLTIRHIGPLILASIIFVALVILSDLFLAQVDQAMGWEKLGKSFVDQMDVPENEKLTYYAMLEDQLSFPSTIISMLLSLYLGLGVTRLGLKVVSGEKFSVGTLFSGAPWLLKGFIAHILYWLMVMFGMILFIFPGIYLALRFGMVQTAIVDKNMGVFEAFTYSARITKHNLLQLFVIILFMVGVMLAGCIALIVGILFAYPVMLLMWIAAYRWLQYGGRAILDDPTTGIPLLAGHTEKTEESPI